MYQQIQDVLSSVGSLLESLIWRLASKYLRFIVSRLTCSPVELQYSSAILDQPRFWPSRMRKTIAKSTESLGLPIPILPAGITDFAELLVYLVSPELFYTHLVYRGEDLPIYQGLSRSIVHIPPHHLKAGMAQNLL